MTADELLDRVQRASDEELPTLALQVVLLIQRNVPRVTRRVLTELLLAHAPN